MAKKRTSTGSTLVPSTTQPKDEKPSVIQQMTVDQAEELRVKFCRAYHRPHQSGETLGHTLGRFLDDVIRSARPDLNRTAVFSAMVPVFESKKLQIDDNTFGTFLNGSYKVVSLRTLADWISRSEEILRLVICGSQGERPKSTNNESSDSSRVSGIAEFIIRYFLPNENSHMILNDPRWYFNENYKRWDHPFRDAEVESELFAIAHYAKKHGADGGRIVRISGWQGFPLQQSSIGDLTSDCIESGVLTEFIVPKLDYESPAQASAARFLESVTGKQGKVIDRQMAVDHPQKSFIEREVISFGRNSRIILIRSNPGFSTAGQRPLSDFLSSNFRWTYLECPGRRSGYRPDSVVRSVVVTRTLTEHSTPFAFCPADEEVSDLRDWILAATG